MTLAAILLVSIFGTVLPWITSSYQTATSTASANQNSNAGVTQSQEAAPPAQPSNTSQAPPSAPPAKTSSGPNAHATTKRHKKKVVPSNCNSAAAGQAAAGAATPNPAPSDPAAAANAATPGTASTPTNCRPSKVIVKQGGTSDASIQLAGGAGSKQTSQDANTAKQMLGTTEANLKEIAGRQLNSSQQDMVTQIKQFMEQSKAAVADGDLDRARTLAWKAQVLSQELVKPTQ